jgi:8-amino-7-oxononanoate synthase
MTAELKRGLDELASLGRLRQLAPRAGADFSSNDYLGLSESAELREAVLAAIGRGVPVGSGGSRLLRGNHPEHEALEAEAAAFFGSEAALYFATGFMANFAIFSTLPQRGDLVVYDELIHASVHDGLRNGRAERVAARHNDVGAVEAAIMKWREGGGTGRPWIAVESLYSMDGDIAPVDDLAALARRHEAMLVIDEAHATGVYGADGRGLAAHLEGAENVVTLHTCGKALGGAGGLVCASRAIRDFLVNRGRSFVFTTAPPPLQAATVRAALSLCRQAPERRERLARLVEHAGRELSQCCGLTPSGTHIMPVVIGAEGPTMEIARALQVQGFDVRGVRPPTVPAGTSRLRISLTLNVDEAQVSALVRAVGAELSGRAA